MDTPTEYRIELRDGSWFVLDHGDEKEIISGPYPTEAVARESADDLLFSDLIEDLCSEQSDIGYKQAVYNISDGGFKDVEDAIYKAAATKQRIMDMWDNRRSRLAGQSEITSPDGV